MNYSEQIEYVLDSDDKTLADYWIELKPKVYFIDGEPVGLVAISDANDIKYISSATKDKYEPFTFSMLRDILSLHKVSSVCIIFEQNGVKTKQIASVLGRYGGAFYDVGVHVLWYNKRSR